MAQPASQRGKRPRQHGAEMSIPVVIEPVEQILHVQAGLGIAFDGQSALEEQGVRILGAGGEFEELGEAAPDTYRRLLGRHRHQPRSLDAKGQAYAAALTDGSRNRRSAMKMRPGGARRECRACGFNMNSDHAAVELTEAFGQRLTAHQVVEGARKKLRVHGIRHQPERYRQYGCEGIHGRRGWWP